MKITITQHSRTVYGMTQFTANINGFVRSFQTDSRGREAKRDARAYFASLAKH